jgi:hypothetical protein
MDLLGSVKIFTDAADALDKIIDGIGKFSGLIASAIGKTAEVVEWHVARNTSKKLSEVLGSSIDLAVSQTARFVPTLEEFANNPTAEFWEEVQSGIANNLTVVRRVTDELKASKMDVITTDFYPALASTLMEREIVLKKLLDAPLPQTSEGIEAFKKFMTKYMTLVEKLKSTNELLRAYIVQLKTQHKWPIKGD